MTLYKQAAMRDLQTLNVTELVDLLANETALYYKMIKERADKKDQTQCKMVIEKIQKEIDGRKKKVFK
jgi:hypothetical protein